MTRFALLRLLTAVPTLLLLAALTFFLLRLAPGGPLDDERALPPEVAAQVAAAYHLDEPLWRQFARYLGGAVRGDLGPSFQYPGREVSAVIAEAFPVSLQVGSAALALALLLGGGAGALAALRRDGFADHGTMVAATAALSVPTFVVAPLLILGFAVGLGWLPAGGWDGWRSGVLPVVALALPLAAAIARLMRTSLVEVLQQGYILTARAKGLPEHVVLLRHALKPALVPVVSFLGPAAAQLLTGSIVVEQLFGIPGLGRHFVQGALNRDYTMVLGVVLFYGALIVLLNFVVDLLYGALDPRVRPQ
ncbi:MAG TPA: ABC transporter permease subunit [Verrucomicrobiae bacterium]|nr:ABC transporter permease subunit [Verrucomicrobiae bacterium]